MSGWRRLLGREHGASVDASVDPVPRQFDHGDPPGWEPVELVGGLPVVAGPYIVGYRDTWSEYEDWDTAWLAHVMRGSSLGRSRLLARAVSGQETT